MAVQLVAPTSDVTSDVTFRLLSAGIPLTLLMDLAAAPHSSQLYAEEESDVAWVHAPPRAG